MRKTPKITMHADGGWSSSSSPVPLEGQRVLTREEQMAWHRKNPDAFPEFQTLATSAGGLVVVVDSAPRELMTEEERADLDARIEATKESKKDDRGDGRDEPRTAGSER